MTILRKTLLAASLLWAVLTPLAALAQAPPAVGALPDTERRTSYSLNASTCACAINLQLYASGSDIDAWLQVWVNGVRYLSTDLNFGWSLSSATGPLSTIPRPITNAVLTFNNAQTGTVQIVGAERPRQLAQFSENTGVPARALNQRMTEITAVERELWDKTNDLTGRGLFSQPGNTMAPLPLPSACVGAYLNFGANGLTPTCLSSGPGTGNVTGPGSSASGHIALWSNTTGSLLYDAGNMQVFSKAACNSVADDTAAIAADIAATPAGGTLVMPSGQCVVSGSGSAIFTLTNPINIIGQGSSASGGGSTILLAPGVPTSRDVFHIVGVTNATERGYIFSNFNVSIGGGTGGKNIFHFDTTAGTTTNLAEVVIDHVYMAANASAGGYSINLDNGVGTNTNGGIFNFSVQNTSYLGGGLNCSYCGDSIRILNNIISTANAGVTATQVAGAGNLLILGNNVSGKAGGVVIAQAVAPVIAFNEFEQQATNTEANNSIIDLTGTVGNISNAKVLGNQVQANVSTGNPTLLRIDTATGTYFDGNRLATPASYVPVVITSNSTTTTIGIGNLYSGDSSPVADSGSGTVQGSIITEAPTTYGPVYSAGGNGLVATAAMTNGQILVGQTSAAPIPKTMSGSCTLAASGAITCGSAGITVGSSTVTSGTNSYVLYNNSGTLGNISPSITVNGTACTLGSSCSPTATATSITVGTTTVASGSNGKIEYNNSGVLGEYSITGTGNVVMSASPTLTGTVAAAAITASGNVTVSNISGLTQCVHASAAGLLSGSGSDCGGGGSPGGSNTQFQYNNSSAFGGVTGVTSDGTAIIIASGDLKLSGSGSGTAVLNAPTTGGGTLTLPAGNATLAATNVVQNWAAAQSYNNGDLLLKGSSSGSMTLEAPAIASTYIMTFPAATDTVAVLGTNQTFSATETFSGTASVTGALNIANTTTSSAGVENKGGVRFIHTYYDGNSTNTNTFVGIGSGNFTLGWDGSNTYTGAENVAVGAANLQSLTTGYGNVAVGFQAGLLVTTGANNFALGVNSMAAETTGNDNIAIGAYSLVNATTAGTNTAIGFDTGATLTTGSANTIIGASVASTTLTTGSGNILIGTSSAVTTPTAATSNYLDIGGVIIGTNIGTVGSEVVSLPGTTAATSPTVASLTLAGGLGVAGKGYFGAPINLQNYIVSTLPAGVRGDMAYVTDAVACTFVATLTGGGTTVCPVFYNGSAWVGG